jgi:hypothetical protein
VTVGEAIEQGGFVYLLHNTNHTYQEWFVCWPLDAQMFNRANLDRRPMWDTEIPPFRRPSRVSQVNMRGLLTRTDLRTVVDIPRPYMFIAFVEVPR